MLYKRNQVGNLRANKHEEHQEVLTDTCEAEKLETLIKTYDKAIHLIPEIRRIKCRILYVMLKFS